MTVPILHLTSGEGWLAGRRGGRYLPESYAREGFIHCSTPEQLLRVANNFFAGQHGLVLLVIDPARLASELRWEPGSDATDELFPHLYGPLNLEAVIRVVALEADAQGRFTHLPS
jgi:uncharacterized protein (DUF952 family)